MNNLNFDTHKFVEDMVRAKMPKAQAEVLAGYYARLLNDSIATLKDSTVNKDDLNNLEKRFGDKLEQTEKRFGDKLEHSQQLLEDKIEAVRAEIKHSQQLLEEKVKQSGQLLEEKVKQSGQLLEEKVKQSEQRLWIRMLVGQIALGGLIIAALQY